MTNLFDVIVVGLGGMGSAAAYHIAARGQRVLGLEQLTSPHDQGSSHGGSRIIRQAYFEDPAYVPLLQRAYELWEALEGDSGRELLTLCGGLMMGTRTSAVVAGSLLSARQWELPHELLDAREIRRRFPTMQPGPDTMALYERKAGFVRPEAAVAAHLQLATEAGAEIRFEEPVTRWSASAGEEGVTVATARGRYQAARLVITPGPWAPRQLPDLGIPFSVRRAVQFWFDPVGGLDAWQPATHPIWIWQLEDPSRTQIYGFPAIDGPAGGVKVAFVRGGIETSPDTIERVVHEGEVEEIRECLASHLPTLRGSLVRAVTCMYTNSPDEHFVIGRHPAWHQVVIAAGFSGHGFKFVPVVGEILADLVTRGDACHPIGLFDPTRSFTSD